MRRRSTFIHAAELDFNPSELKIEDGHFSFAGLKASREERLTYGLEELPLEVRHVLQQSYELHLRWTRETPYRSSIPQLSSLTPGLHSHFTPLKQQQDDLFCPLLRKVFASDLKCASPKETFTSPSLITERFSSATELQYYSILPSLNHLVAYLQRDVCSRSDISCFHTVSLLNLVDFLDIDYDGISHALTVTAYWSQPPAVLYDPVGEWTTFDHWNLAIDPSARDRVEVGVLSSSSAVDAHELQLGGFLVVVGEDQTPTPTSFSFPSRHHLPQSSGKDRQSFKVAFSHPTGLHPTLEISFPSRSRLQQPNNAPLGSVCALHSYLTLPSYIFADEYAFAGADPLFQAAHNIRSLRAIAGELDLEAPDYVVDKWGSSMLLELATPNLTSVALDGPDEPWKATIPLHLRYLSPAPGGLSEVRVPWPNVFWACTAEEGTKFPVNPFDRIHLGYDSLFGPRTMFYHLTPMSGPEGKGQLVETIKVPVLNTSSASSRLIDLGTLAVILLGFGWVLIKLWPRNRIGLSLKRSTDVQTSTDKKKQ